MGEQQLEAISVIYEFKWLDEFFANLIYGRGKVVEFGNVDANVDHEVYTALSGIDTMISTNDYHRRLD